MMFQEADSNHRIDEVGIESVSAVLKRVWKEEDLELYYTGHRLYLATVDGDLSKLHIVFDDHKSIKIGHLLRDSEIEILRELWPEGAKVWEIRPPQELSTDKLTRVEAQKMIDRSEKRILKKVDEYFEKFLKSQRDFMTSQMKVTELLIKATSEAFGKKLDEVYNRRIMGNRSIPAIKNIETEIIDGQEKPKIKDLVPFKDVDEQIDPEDLEEKILNTLIRSEMVEEFLRSKQTAYRPEYEPEFNPYKQGETSKEKIDEEEMHGEIENKDWKPVYGKREMEDNLHDNIHATKSKVESWRTGTESWDRSGPGGRGSYRKVPRKKNLEKTRCFSCGKNGHLSTSCPTPGLVHCYRCNKTGNHLAKDCREYKSKEKRETYRDPPAKRKYDDSYREKSPRESYPPSTSRDDKGDWKRSKATAYWSDSEADHKAGGEESDGSRY